MAAVTHHLGTRDGLYPFDGDGVEHVLGDGPVQVASGGPGTFARTRSLLYRVDGADWATVDVPTDEPTAVAVTGDAVHVGAADPLALLSSRDGGAS